MWRLTAAVRNPLILKGWSWECSAQVRKQTNKLQTNQEDASCGVRAFDCQSRGRRFDPCPQLVLFTLGKGDWLLLPLSTQQYLKWVPGTWTANECWMPKYERQWQHCLYASQEVELVMVWPGPSGECCKAPWVVVSMRYVRYINPTIIIIIIYFDYATGIRIMKK